jgi:hypothetical protein
LGNYGYWKDLTTPTLLLQIAISRMEREREREREAVECGGRKEEGAGTGGQLLCQVRSSAHYYTSCKQKSCGLTHTHTHRNTERERERARERKALESPESLGSSIYGI